MKLSNDAYNVLKWIAIIALPALATFYGVIGKIWDIPYTAEIVTTVTAIATFIGALIGVSTMKYNKDKEDGNEKTL